jgi:hypothetical protein
MDNRDQIGENFVIMIDAPKKTSKFYAIARQHDLIYLIKQKTSRGLLSSRLSTVHQYCSAVPPSCYNPLILKGRDDLDQGFYRKNPIARFIIELRA